MLTISPARQGEFMVMSLVGRIDASNSKDLEEQCLDMISNGEIQIIFDKITVLIYDLHKCGIINLVKFWGLSSNGTH